MTDPVEAQLEAYNRRDVDAFMACFASGVSVRRLSGEVIVADWDTMRERYATLFEAEPGVRCEVVTRIRQGDWVIDQEDLTGYANGWTMKAVAIYRVKDGMISEVLFA